MPRHRLPAELAVLAALILVLAALGPFGSYATPIGPRLLHWALYLVTGYVFFRPVIAAGGALARQTGLPRLVAIAAACAFGAFPTSMVIVFASAGPAWHMVPGATLVSAYVQTLIIGATVTMVQLLAGRGAGPAEGSTAMPLAPAATAEEDAPPPGADAPAAPALLDQLPPHLRGPILCLENEDHYVRVHTVHGNALLLMRMRDAVAQLEGRGERVHRSWWVASDAVAGAVRQERNWKLRLFDGREVPVARANVQALRAAGWLDGTGPAS
ncbi:LytTR family DNA-binding domain-containing protein [Sphingomonas pituitosa]|uniref:LytTR family DNA-binding domain-containing protein n=1 Tax=Sphingomonas pituitosa TaxID=99597 RepID=UPI000832C15A|nr:LytTR family DNA-binding domain-containing protein [Sphingomonas pituitosa]